MKPFEGTAEVAITRLRSGRRVDSLSVSDSRFRKRLRPGRYSLVARVADPCWTADPVETRVRDGRFERVRLTVTNKCIR